MAFQLEIYYEPSLVDKLFYAALSIVFLNYFLEILNIESMIITGRKCRRI